MDWNLLWFFLLGILLAGYAILDGFDFGVGMLHPVAKTDEERRILINAIGPLWDGNEVWLVTFGGALFAAFPEAYATIFSGYYEALMLVLGCLIFRAISIEFRSKRPERWWRSTWDTAFFLSSLIVSFGFGLAVGSAMIGIPLDERGIFRGSITDQIGLYGLFVGLLTVAMFQMHGAIFLVFKTKDDLQQRLIRWTWRGYYAFLTMFVVVTVATWLWIPRAVATFEHFPIGWLVVVLMFLAVANIPRSLNHQWYMQAFFSSTCTVAALVFLLGVALFPNMVTSSPHPENSLTIYNAASSQSTLKLMSLIALLGMPFVIGYTIMVYRTFRGPVKLDKHSY
ncbi:cytochrome d ubiquinol oxidase subunit II [Rubinisphaera margarita]|uniref:cytochrome d ubiquinol oxidase subunit II n=1 Tax=Rubinisphaera margarita TaxID=2909586 RepID=UPI001EE98A7F|nr:cytochrome d ubiquinol oxidase subunit II [Rubinisphaera margarita]MCG6155137.1 cytochrome d ubiquinol oxidase subunit II [Rubinisphaera margarita]